MAGVGWPSGQIDLDRYFAFVFVSGFTGALLNVAGPLLIESRFAGGNAPRAAIYLFYSTAVYICASVAINALYAPLADTPAVGRKPGLVFRVFGAAAAAVVLGVGRASLGSLLASSAVLGGTGPSVAAALLIDVLARGATARAFWLRATPRCLFCLVGRLAGPDAPVEAKSEGRASEAAHTVELTRLYVASGIVSAVGVIPGSVAGLAVYVQYGLHANLTVAAVLNVFAGLFGCFVLNETLRPETTPAREAKSLRARYVEARAELRKFKFAELWSTLYGDAADVVRKAYVRALLIVAFTVALVSYTIIYYGRWRHGASDQVYFVMQFTLILGVVFGFFVYWFWARERFGYAACLSFYGYGQCVVWLVLAAATDVAWWFPAVFLAGCLVPNLIGLLVITASITAGKQGRLQAALAIAVVAWAIAGLGLSLGVWLLTKGHHERGSHATRHNYASASPWFLGSALSLAIPAVLRPAVKAESIERVEARGDHDGRAVVGSEETGARSEAL
ncbi:hypothetical protein M885DRAFT_510061 [Pelagophyceae sp. CCMP2097]|nr:hypothetical protein M885DRAFT_510061 [Pelagophyceae sp. CCMP2097]